MVSLETAPVPARTSAPDAGGGAAEAALARAEWVPVLFAERPRRAELLALRASWPLDTVRVRVHRNLAAEFVTSVAQPYLAFAGLQAEWLYGDYDDSLAFAEVGGADAEVVWLDYDRFAGPGGAERAEWLGARLSALRAATRAPVLVTADPRETPDAAAFNAALHAAADRLPGVYVCDLAPACAEFGPAFFDARNAKLSGLPYANAAAVVLGRLLGARWLPSVLRPGLKAVAVDLDHTLYAGVLGEDGPAGVELTPGHAALQGALVALRDAGLFLAVCSKNEDADVVSLFAARPDFPLRLEHLSARAVSWEGKAAGLQRIADALRIAPDAVLYVDDNPGELAAVAAALPGLRTLHAPADAELTVRALRDYPGLHRWRVDEADRVRAADLAAASAREVATRSSESPAEYLRSLHVRVGFRVDSADDVERLHALSNKTNQFNLALRRAALADVAEYQAAPDASVVAVRLADRLSDSGVIGGVFLRRAGDVCRVEEVCVSCRALGRGLDDLLVLGAIRAGCAGDSVPSAVEFVHATAPRNGPARRWLEALLGHPLEVESGVTRVDWATCAARVADVEALLGAGAVTTEGA